MEKADQRLKRVMSRDCAMSAAHAGEGSSEEGPAPAHPPIRQEVMSPGAAKDGGCDYPHLEASAAGRTAPTGLQEAKEVTSSDGTTLRQRHEQTALSPVRRERTSDGVRCRGLRSHTARRPHPPEPPYSGGFFYVGGANGVDIVRSYCESKGWTRIENKQREDFKLKWCETRSRANYSNFRPGQQLMFQIPNNDVLTTKIGLLRSLREYERVRSKVRHCQGVRLKMDEFIPTTFRMDVREEREAFFSQQEGLVTNQRHMWICKPTGLNQGRGIFLLKSHEDVNALRERLQHGHQHRKTPLHRQQARVVQKYIQNPLLLKGRKFDVRSFLIIACPCPYVVFFSHGYVRLTCDQYDLQSPNMATHLTNQYMQKKNPLYSQLKEDTVWSMESFNAYVNERFAETKALPRDWVLGLFTKRMQQILTQCFLSVKAKLDCRLGFFDMIGCDFMIDEDFNVWLLEMNCNPALHTNCSVLKEVIPNIVSETLDLTLEIFNKCRRGQRVLPLSSQKNFVLLFKELFPPEAAEPFPKSSTTTHCEQRKKPEHQRNSLQSAAALAGGECRSPPQTSHVSKPKKKKVPLKCSTVSPPMDPPPGLRQAQ
ncbi:unnamed protein product [Knipowitschia caucasica]|uniref:Uncharacterized protein n=1 Tax=Knipowitschia caucasica TaxID=637954 RepID=A0AAV2LWA9_KNICA